MMRQANRPRTRHREGVRLFTTLHGELGEILREYNARAAKRSKQCSHATMEVRRRVIEQCFVELDGLGYRMKSPYSFAERHLKVLVKHWVGNGISPGVIQNRLSILRTFSGWIGKPGMVKRSESYVDDPSQVKRSYIPDRDKSWSGREVDIESVLRAVSEYDAAVGMMLEIEFAFGLRRKEAIMFKPRLVVTSDGSEIQIYDGTKGGRHRNIKVDTAYKRDVLARAQGMVRNPQDSLFLGRYSLQQAIRRYNYVMEKFGLTKKDLGVTGHGLRHQFMNDRYEQLSGHKSPIRGGDYRALDLEKEMAVRRSIMLEAGHGRVSIARAYYGRLRSRSKQSAPAA